MQTGSVMQHDTDTQVKNKIGALYNHLDGESMKVMNL